MAAAAERLEPTVTVPGQLPDEDPAETQEWLESLDGLVEHAGPVRAKALLLRVLQRARERQVDVPGPLTTDYVNTIPPAAEPEFPGDESLERRLRAYSRWKAVSRYDDLEALLKLDPVHEVDEAGWPVPRAD